MEGYIVKIKGVDGVVRDAKDTDEIQPGETAYMEPIKPEEPAPVSVEEFSVIDRMAGFFGVTLSDFIEGAAKTFGIPPCMACQMRQRVLYAIKHIGVLRATILLMKTFAGKFGAAEAARIQAELEKAVEDGR